MEKSNINVARCSKSKVTTFAVVLFSLLVCLFPYPLLGAPGVYEQVEIILSESTSPSLVPEKIAALAKNMPSEAPQIVLYALERYEKSLPAADFTPVAESIIRALASEAPETLPLVLEEVLSRYPELALPLASVAVSVQPSMVEQIADAVMTACPELDVRELSSALSAATGNPDGSFDYLFSGFSQSGVEIPQPSGGGGGSPIYQR
jgi:hypothetical protein